MGALGVVGKGLAVAVALVAVVLASFRGDPDSALRSLPFPIGAAAYLALGGEIPPFFNPAALKNDTQFRLWAKPGDAIIAACPKCGNTWMMNILHQLRVAENHTLAEEFVDILDVTPWPILRYKIGDSVKDTMSAIESKSEWWNNEKYPYRAFKIQSVPSDTPIQRFAGDSGALLPYVPFLKYVVVVRNPYEQFESALHFFSSLNPEMNSLFKFPSMPLRMMVPFLMESPLNAAHYLNGWSHHFDKDNVFLVHFADLKSEPEKWVRRIADFLEVEVPDQHWPDVLRRVSFKWMKEHSDKFLYRRPDGLTLTTQVVRTGKSGGKFSLATDEEIAALKAKLELNVPPALLDFAIHGGEERRRKVLGHD